MTDRLPIQGSRGAYLVSRETGWHIVTPEGECELGIKHAYPVLSQSRGLDD
jgi:hypothetical protein